MEERTPAAPGLGLIFDNGQPQSTTLTTTLGEGPSTITPMNSLDRGATNEASESVKNDNRPVHVPDAVAIAASVQDTDDLSLTRAVTEDEKEIQPREGPGIISITATMTSSLKRLLSAWLVFNYNEETKLIIVEPSHIQLSYVFAEEEIGHIAQLLESLDISRSELVSINENSWKEHPAVGQAQEQMIGLEGHFTLVFRRIGADEFTKHAIFLKPVLEPDEDNLPPEAAIAAAASALEGIDIDQSNNGVDAHAETSMEDFDGIIPCIRLPKEDDPSVPASPNRPEGESGDNTNNTDTDHVEGEASEESRAIGDISNNIDIDATTTSTASAGAVSTSTSSGTASTELCIGPMSDKKRSWQKYSPLEEGDRILSLNGKDDHVAGLTSREAETVIETMYTCSPYLSIVVNTPPSERRQRGRGWRARLVKGAVAVGGGTMVGAGAILMVTPLHPIGHAMAIGGMGVLGTQYEQPRRLANRASSSFSNLASRVSSSNLANRVRMSLQGGNQTDPLPAEGDGDSVVSTHTAETESISDHSEEP